MELAAALTNDINEPVDTFIGDFFTSKQVKVKCVKFGEISRKTICQIFQEIICDILTPEGKSTTPNGMLEKYSIKFRFRYSRSFKCLSCLTKNTRPAVEIL